MRKTEIFILGIILLSFIIGAYYYPLMPDRVASHWNAEGEANGYMPKFWGLFIMPILSLSLYFLFAIIPKIDPRRANIEKFRQYYDGFIAVLTAFLFYIYLLTIVWNLGIRFEMIRMLVPAFSALFYYLGILTANAKQNWFIGIRTPWTLSSEKVWDVTHKAGGTLFKIAGIAALLGLVFEKYAIWFVIAPVILISIYLVIYSYMLWKKGEK